MYKNKRVLAIVPARGGSKGITLKNIREINGKSLIGYVSDRLKELDWIDFSMVSTDHDAIADESGKYGLTVPFMRPEELSGDRVADIPVLKHALLEIEKLNNTVYDIILMLQPTCPLRKADHITQTVDKLIDENRTAVWTVSETDSKAHPLKQFSLNANGDISYYDVAGKKIIARQQLEPLYHKNGACYAILRDTIVSHESLEGINPAAVIISDFLVNIDTEEDLQYAQWAINNL